MNKRKTARIFNDLSMAFFLISSTVVAFLPIADREKHPAIAVSVSYTHLTLPTKLEV